MSDEKSGLIVKYFQLVCIYAPQNHIQIKECTHPIAPKKKQTFTILDYTPTFPPGNLREIFLFDRLFCLSTSPVVSQKPVKEHTFRDPLLFVTSMISPFLKLRSPLCSPSNANCAIYWSLPRESFLVNKGLGAVGRAGFSPYAIVVDRFGRGAGLSE
jgi:hypothetical protein